MAVFCFQRRAGVLADGALKRRLQSVYRVHKTRREFVVTLSVSPLPPSLSLSLVLSFSQLLASGTPRLVLFVPRNEERREFIARARFLQAPGDARLRPS